MSGSHVALLGTSADPPTRGHQALLEGLLNYYELVVTWASDNPMKQHGASLDLRCTMLRTLVDQINHVRLNLVQDLSSPHTITTLKRAAQLWPDQKLVFVVGSDLAEQIPRWKQTELWLPHCRLAIAPRYGWALNATALNQLKSLGARVDVLELDLPAAASSKLRLKPDPTQVPESIWQLLLQHNLYGLSPSRC